MNTKEDDGTAESGSGISVWGKGRRGEIPG